MKILLCLVLFFYSALGFAHSITQISAAGQYVCALDTAGVRCKGDQWVSSIPSFNHPKRIFSTAWAVVVLDDDGLESWRQQSRSKYHISNDQPSYYNEVDTSVCTLGNDGVKCRADPTESGYGYITKVPPFKNVKMMVSLASTACAVADGDVSCWGEKFHPAAGYQVIDKPTFQNPFYIALSDSNACALDDVGAHCWGINDGILNVPPLKHPKQIAIGWSYACALDDDGVKCWGDDVPDQIEMNSFKNPRMLSSASSGGANLCVLDDVGVWCWDAISFKSPFKTPLKLMLQ